MCSEKSHGLGKHLTLPATDQAGEGDQQVVHKSLSPTLPATDQAGEGDQRGVHKLLSFFSVSPSAGYRVTGAVAWPGLTIAQVSFSVRVVIVERLTTEAILGMDFLMGNNCTIQVGKKHLEFPKLSVSVPLICRRSVPSK